MSEVDENYEAMVADLRPEFKEDPQLNKIREAVARGWCTPENESKVVDPVLAEAISREVLKVI